MDILFTIFCVLYDHITIVLGIAILICLIGLPLVAMYEALTGNKL